VVRREAQRLDDIANAIGEIRRYTAGMGVKAYLQDAQVQQAVAWALTIVGEAIKALPSELRGRHKAVAWTKWAGLRDFLVHQYFRIDQRRIWRIVQRDIPPLEAAVAAELRRIVSDDDEI
jgi:uncharacterized protein with HEPN domain